MHPSRSAAGSADVHFTAGGVSAPGSGDVDVVKVTRSRTLCAVGRVVDAAPNGILHPESSRVLQHERDDLISERDALGLLGLGIVTSSAKPLGCHPSASGRTPPIW